jgi:hypothetical protein
MIEMRYSWAILAAGLAAFGMGEARACTLGKMQDNLARLSEMIRIHNANRDDQLARGHDLPAEIEDRRQELIQQTAAIRVLFSAHLAPDMKKDDEMDAAICSRADNLIARHAASLPAMPEGNGDGQKVEAAVNNAKKEKKEEKPHCRQENIRKRFGDAVRKQRKLRIAGKINPRERMEYMNMTNSFSNMLKTDFDQACTILASYEKRLAREKGEEEEN